MPHRNVPPALLRHPEWASTRAADALRLWSELPDRPAGILDLAAAAERAALAGPHLQDALALLERAGLVVQGTHGYTRCGAA